MQDRKQRSIPTFACPVLNDKILVAKPDFIKLLMTIITTRNFRSSLHQGQWIASVTINTELCTQRDHNEESTKFILEESKTSRIIKCTFTNTCRNRSARNHLTSLSITWEHFLGENKVVMTAHFVHKEFCNPFSRWIIVISTYLEPKDWNSHQITEYIK